MERGAATVQRRLRVTVLGLVLERGAATVLRRAVRLKT